MRVAGVIIPKEKRVVVSLTYIYGIGPTTAKNILLQTNIDASTRTKDLTREQEDLLRNIIKQKHKTEGDLRREIMMNIKRLKEVGTYRGLRHIRGLPARGQRTKTNSRTRRGNVRKTMGSGRKPASSPT